MKQGYVFVPYIIKESTSIISDSNLYHRNIIKSRYSTTNINSSFYGTIGNSILLIERRKKIEKIKNIMNG